MNKWVIPVLQTIFILLIVSSFYAISIFGEKYILRSVPFDPFNPFYGEFVMLQYPDLNASNSLEDGTVYFNLKSSSDGFATIDEISTDWFFGSIKGYKFDNRISVNQLEQFYVEQGTGIQLENARELKSTIYVSPWGTIRPISLEKRN